MHSQLELFEMEKDYRIDRLRQSIKFQMSSDPLWRFTIRSLLQCEKDFGIDGRKALKIQEEILSIKAAIHDKAVKEQYTKG
jgi:hypothetical protein